jgi:drug/metabolite transporter (DMT)-like permease
VSEEGANSFRNVALPFLIFTGIWGGTWIVITGQITVPAQWSVAYRFLISAAAMIVIALVRGEKLAMKRRHWPALAFLGFTQFSVNFNAVYIAEQHITSGVVATVFALLLIPSSLLGWAMLGQRPNMRFVWGSVVAVAGIGLLFAHEMHAGAASPRQVAAGIGVTLIGMLGASTANVFQAREKMRQLPMFSMLAWAMGLGALFDCLFALAIAGPPRVDLSLGYIAGLLYLALAASVLSFSLYYPVIRRIGPAKAAYSSMAVPIIAMGFSTWLEHYRWTVTTVSGALLALGGMALALSRNRSKVVVTDAA